MLRALCGTFAALKPLMDANCEIKSQIHFWMSLSGTLSEDFLSDLDAHLSNCAFVANTAMASLADLDLYFSLAKLWSNNKNDNKSNIGSLLHVRRWVRAVEVVLNKMNLALGKEYGIVLPDGISLEKFSECSKNVPYMPAFYYPEHSSVTAVHESVSSTGGECSGAADHAKNKGGSDNGAGGKAVTSSGGGGELTEEQKKAAAEKRAKKKADKKNKAKTDGKKAAAAAPSELSISALDIRVGKILKAWEHPDAEKLYCEEVDVGEEKPRQIASGLRPFYTLDEMQNQTVLVLCNLKARNLVGFPSHGMVMCASNADHTKVEFAVPPEGAEVGSRVVFEGYSGDPEPENRVAKKKIFEKLATDLKTDGDGNVVWKGSLGKIGPSPCRA
eukprot:CAMPEP_0116077268 /NCGR_PEP_ID=MMETSP0322-20121206/17747_1 /TAXON_ID=163516 /ORGANISM="Leptocylindrus danicus var. apora, Strain B651" /LENGTH=386 /DNA_ID=CAMNT_0003567721 /DNA_START=182 /DNA_END=1338 /DNA_ORIENTATION=-